MKQADLEWTKKVPFSSMKRLEYAGQNVRKPIIR